TFRDLQASDERVQAHIDGLVVGGSAAWDLLQEGFGSDIAGEEFLAAVVALDGGSKQARGVLRDVLLAAKEPRAPLIHALGLTLAADADSFLDELGRGAQPALTAMLLDAMTLRGRTVPDLRTLLEHEDLSIVSVALRTTVSSRAEAAVPLVKNLAGRIGPHRNDALVTLAAFDPSLARRQARERFRAGDTDAALAQVLALTGDAGDTEIVSEMAGSAESALARAGVAALGTLGDPAGVRMLLRSLESADQADMASVSLRRIFGAALPWDDLLASSENVADEDGQASPEAPVLDAKAVAAWWSRESKRFPAGTRLRSGEPFAPRAPRPETPLAFRAEEIFEYVTADRARRWLDTRDWASRQVSQLG
ncbi:MAG: hypothetical protein KC729_06430, partial [Candidatus Eisenbacteria bacterium]|nr:hypothetical protein [Candidatus Eisenbacteria bacterium]